MRERTRSINNTTDFLITPIMYAPLETSLVLRKGTGAPTWSRATKAWGFNELGYLEELASGCAFFGGARLVRNTVRTTSEDFSNAAYLKTNVTVTGTNTIVCSNTTAQMGVFQSLGTPPSVVIGQHFLYGYRVRYVSGGAEFVQVMSGAVGFGTDFINVSLLDGTSSTTGGVFSRVTEVVPGTYDIILRAVADANAAGDYAGIAFCADLSSSRYPNFVGDGIKSFELLRAWSVDVTGYDASYVPEYVSVGVEASPYFGAGIDGAKYFSTDYTGGRALTNLVGFRRDIASTNRLLYCRNLTNNSWMQTVTTGSEIITNGTFNADTNWTKGSGWSISAGVATRTDVGSSSNLVQAVSISAGTAYLISYDLTVSSGNITATFGGGTTATGIQRTATGTYSEVLIPNSGNYELRMNASSTFAGTLDNVSIKVAAVQPAMTATGLDGIANTATTLTASAADAIILQPITLASSDRCASAYVKRRTGTGTISFTQDGGSSWTDITSLINASTWSRVEITATVTNPSTGFKISTSGDAIDVDCVQNEGGGVATSPILTTTAAVTRNVDSLSYQMAGNIDTAIGTISYTAQIITEISTTRYAIKVGSSGSYLIATTATRNRNYDSTNICEKTGLSDIRTALRKRAVTWGPSGLSSTGDGLAPATSVFDGSWGDDGASIGIISSASAYIGPVAIYNYQMTDAQLQEVTK